jgi:sugar phosphate isomerase/epimerase
MNPAVENGFNAGVISHHSLIVSRFIMLEEIYRKYGIGSVITMHPVTISVDGCEFLSERDAIANSKILFDRLDKFRIDFNHQTLIGIENQTDLKQKAGTLGFLPSHFKRMLQDTRTIGITIDTGHRRLAQDFSIGKFLSLGFTVNNFHFHGNDGVFNPIDWSDDHHVLPTKDNVSANKNAYGNFLRYFRRHRSPIVLEISHLENYSDDELRNFLIQFKQELV